MIYQLFTFLLESFFYFSKELWLGFVRKTFPHLKTTMQTYCTIINMWKDTTYGLLSLHIKKMEKEWVIIQLKGFHNLLFILQCLRFSFLKCLFRWNYIHSLKFFLPHKLQNSSHFPSYEKQEFFDQSFLELKRKVECTKTTMAKNHCPGYTRLYHSHHATRHWFSTCRCPHKSHLSMISYHEFFT